MSRTPAYASCRSGAFGSTGFDIFTTRSTLDALEMAGEGPAYGPATRRQLVRLGAYRAAVGTRPGLRPDGWATSYVGDCMACIDETPPNAHATFFLGLSDRGAFSLGAGLGADMWSTAAAMRALTGRLGVDLPDPNATLRWIARSQTTAGGLSWSPAWADRLAPDVRATSLAIQALSVAGLVEAAAAYVDFPALIDWLKAQQDVSGGFVYNGFVDVPCVWATGEALMTLRRLGSAPNRSGEAASFIEGLRAADGGYRRGPSYLGSDALATRHALLGLRAIGQDEFSAETVAYLRSCEDPAGGARHRPLDDSPDVYSTAAALIAGMAIDRPGAQAFLRSCRMAEDGGIAYQCGRGGEMGAAQFVCLVDPDGVDRGRLVRWAAHCRNPDGGWGLFEGRASEAATTTAIVTTLHSLGLLCDLPVDLDATRSWCFNRWERLLAAGDRDLVELSCLYRAMLALGSVPDPAPLAEALSTRATDGGWSRRAGARPDMITTYQALLAHEAIGGLDDVLPGATQWARGLRHEAGCSWRPGPPVDGGPLPAALLTLIEQASDVSRGLPDITL